MSTINPDEALKLAQEQADQDARLEDDAALAAALDQGERIGELEKKIEQLQHSTVDGALIERLLISDGQGGIRGVVGGASGLQIKDSTQPTPTMPILEEVSELGVVEVRWDGEVTSSQQIPRGSAFGRVQSRHRLIEGGVQPDPEGPDWREGGAIGSYRGGTTTVALGQPGTHAIWFYMAGPNNVEQSKFSQPLIVEVEPLVDREEIQQWIDEKGEELEEYVHDYGNREGTTVPTEDAPEGVVYYQKDDQGRVMGIWQSRGEGDWVGLPLNSEVLVSVTTDKLVAGESLIDGVLIKDGAVTLEKITVTKELVAELARFLTVEADMISANAIDGMTIRGGVLEGGVVRGGVVEVGNRYDPNRTGNQGTIIDLNGAFFHFNSDDKIDTRINGASNLFSGTFTTELDGASSISLERGSSYGRAVIFFKPRDTNYHRDAQLSMGTGDAADSFEAGTIDLVAAQQTSSTPAARLNLYPNGNFALRQVTGTNTNIGIWKNSRYIDIQGRNRNYSPNLLNSGVTDTFSASGIAATGVWAVYGGPPPTGTRTLVATPSYRHSSALHRASVGVARVNPSNSLIAVGDFSGGGTWRVHWIAIWD